MKKLRLIAMSVAVILGISSMHLPAYASSESGEVTTVLACSDFQNPSGNDAGKAEVQAIINAMELTEKADGFFCCGDYDTALPRTEAERLTVTQAGVTALAEAVSNAVTENMVFVQGNHDSKIGTSGMSQSGDNDPDGDAYSVFVINEDDYMQYNDNEERIKYTAQTLIDYLNVKISEEYDKPIFVLSHLPLHYTFRTYYEYDGQYANYIFDVLNEAGKKGLNIVFVYGHNHSNGWDDYNGGSSVFLAKGDNILVPQYSKTDFATCQLAFTYMNAGYVGYYSNYNGADDALTMTKFDISDTTLTITRYDKNGVHNLKSKGIQNHYKNENGYTPNTTVYNSSQVIELTKVQDTTSIKDLIGRADSVTEATGVRYEWYDDISAYRVKTGNYYETVPEKAGYVFGGWFTDSTDTSDAIAGTTGRAWAKFVPEETLTVKAQVNTSLKDVDLTKTDIDKVNLRLVTTVDSLKYNSVGFEIAMDGNAAVDYPMEEVYKTIKIRDDEKNNYFVNPSESFECAASARFATLRITMIPNTNQEFTTLDISVTPYWITKDGSKVEGIVRSNLLISDELANYDDTNNTMNETAISKEASYAYYKGASDKVYFAGTYTKNAQTGNYYGITIRNGGQTRQVYYDGVGIKVHENGSISASGAYNALQHANGIFVWSQSGNSSNASVTKNNSEVSKMLDAAAGTTHTVVWAIEENVLYGSVNGDVFLRIPMNVLCSDWVDGRYYQLGIASYNEAVATKALFAKSTLAMGKAAYGTEEAPLMVAEKEELTLTNMAYEPITGSYMSGTRVNGYAYGKAVDSKDAIAMEFDLKWQDFSKSRSFVGITVKVGEESRQILFENLGGNAFKPRIQKDHSSTVQFWLNSGNIYRILSNPFADETANVKATVYDGTLSVLINDVSAYQCALSDETQLFGSNYSANVAISLGVATWDSPSGLACFDDLTFYEGQEAVELKKEKWTFYSKGESDGDYVPLANVDVENGRIKKSKNLNGRKSPISIGSAADVWEVTGTMTHGASTATNYRQGFSLAPAGDNALTHIIGSAEGFIPYANNGGENWNYSSKLGQVVFQKNTDICNNYFKNQNAAECPFKIVIAYDTAYVWLNGVFAWMIPLTEADFGSYTSGSDYELKLTIFGNNQDCQQAFENIKVKTGREVDTEFLTTLKSAKDFDWYTARDMRTLTTDGELVVRDTYEGKYSDMWGTTSSHSIYMSGNYTMTNDKTDNMWNLSGILISDGTNVRRISLRNFGIRVVADATDNDTVPEEMGLTNLPTSANSYSFLKYSNPKVEYREYVYGKEEGKEKSPVREMFDSVKGSEHQVIWAIQNHTLYLSVNGEIALIMPLDRLCKEWTVDKNHTYKIGVNEQVHERCTSISNWTTLYGADADAVLYTDNCKGIVENPGMLYDAITGAYVGRFSRDFRGAYGAAGKTVGLEAEITCQDKNNNLTCAGISVKSEQGSIQVYTIGNSVRLQKNEKWENVEYLTNLLPEGIITYDANGKCQVSANVENDVLYIKYNGVDALQINLGDETYGIPSYVAGSEVQIGIGTWNVNEGLALFRNVKIVK